MKYTPSSLVRDIAKTQRGKILLDKYLPSWERYPCADYMALRYFIYDCPSVEGLNPESVYALLEELNTPVETNMPNLMAQPSLDDLDNASYFKNGATPVLPLDGEATECALLEGSLPVAEPRSTQPLDGAWKLAFDQDGRPDWAGAMEAPVPGSVHTALMNAGVIPDATFGRNQQIALKYSYMDWWYRKTFTADPDARAAQLVFTGVCNKCEIYLNGEMIGAHEGMFGGPVIDVTGKLKAENELVVRLFAIPFEQRSNRAQDPTRSADDLNESWRNTVVINNVYGWHYSCLPSIGIWNNVRLEYLPTLRLSDPFIATMDEQTAQMRLRVDYAGELERFEGKLTVNIAPENFEGKALCFDAPVSGGKAGRFLMAFAIPDARLWWPNQLGAQNLYRLTVSLDADGKGESVQTTFGVRTVRMAPLGDGPKKDHYNWRFIVNGKDVFIRGTGWCTMDALLDLRPERYERFLSLAKIQNCQMIRAWGAGMPETDCFYKLCDQYGIMVMQEWPTAWNSHLTQPYDMLEETVRENTLRIRNHPSLILYCPGNESENPYGEAIDMMGRHSFELDGTRTFHRGEPFGGALHNYYSYWGRESMDVHANLEADFFGEFGIACTPCAESVNRYLPAEEQNVWPSKPFSAFEYHTPIFGTAFDLSRLSQMSGYFAHPGCSFEEMTLASQMSQIVGVRHTLERARIRYPYCGGALYYKLNDNFPAMSWASVDWYGAPKLGHYVFQKSFAPTAAFLLVDHLNFAGTAHALPLYVVDDFAADDARYEAKVTVCNGKLEVLQEKRFTMTGNAHNPDLLGQIEIAYEQTLTPPILVRIELSKNDCPVFDTFYFFNYEAQKGCLFDLPRTTLSLRTEPGAVVLKNEGTQIAIGAMVERPGHADTFTAMENFVWLNPGEERRISVDCTDGLSARALNA